MHAKAAGWTINWLSNAIRANISKRFDEKSGELGKVKFFKVSGLFGDHTHGG